MIKGGRGKRRRHRVQEEGRRKDGRMEKEGKEGKKMRTDRKKQEEEEEEEGRCNEEREESEEGEEKKEDEEGGGENFLRQFVKVALTGLLATLRDGWGAEPWRGCCLMTAHDCWGRPPHPRPSPT